MQMGSTPRPAGQLVVVAAMNARPLSERRNAGSIMLAEQSLEHGNDLMGADVPLDMTDQPAAAVLIDHIQNPQEESSAVTLETTS